MFVHTGAPLVPGQAAMPPGVVVPPPGWQVPALQKVLAGQTRPQPPQFAGSLPGSVQNEDCAAFMHRIIGTGQLVGPPPPVVPATQRPVGSQAWPSMQIFGELRQS